MARLTCRPMMLENPKRKRRRPQSKPSARSRSRKHLRRTSRERFVIEGMIEKGKGKHKHRFVYWDGKKFSPMRRLLYPSRATATKVAKRVLKKHPSVIFARVVKA